MPTLTKIRMKPRGRRSGAPSPTRKRRLHKNLPVHSPPPIPHALPQSATPTAPSEREPKQASLFEGRRRKRQSAALPAEVGAEGDVGGGSAEGGDGVRSTATAWATSCPPYLLTLNSSTQRCLRRDLYILQGFVSCQHSWRRLFSKRCLFFCRIFCLRLRFAQRTPRKLHCLFSNFSQQPPLHLLAI